MKKYNQLFQHGTGSIIVPGLFDGTLSIHDLMKHGDTGMGSGEGLDGELIILDGTPYLINGDGKISIADDRFTVPFANAHFANYSMMHNMHIKNNKALGALIFKQYPYRNLLFSVKLQGSFEHVKARSVYKQAKPYPTLVETANQENIFEADNIKGTIIGYYNPNMFSKLAVSGFHFHFLDDDLQMGGHLMNFSGFNGDLGIQTFNKLDLELPNDNEDYLHHDFSKDDVEGAINQAEKE